MLPWVMKGIVGTALDHYQCKTNAVGVNDLIGKGVGHQGVMKGKIEVLFSSLGSRS